MTKGSKKTPTTPSKKVAPRRAPARYTLFVTRDSNPDTGEPSKHVEAWFARPDRFPLGEKGAFWLPESGTADRAAVWTLDVCWRHAGTIPDDDRQCLRIEGDALRAVS